SVGLLRQDDRLSDRRGREQREQVDCRLLQLDDGRLGVEGGEGDHGRVRIGRVGHRAAVASLCLEAVPAEDQVLHVEGPTVDLWLVMPLGVRLDLYAQREAVGRPFPGLSDIRYE